MGRVTLSFDNGPDPDTTPGVLDTLARHGIRTAFFVIGRGLPRGAGREFRQDFPPDCVPIRDGRQVGPIDAYVRAMA